MNDSLASQQKSKKDGRRCAECPSFVFGAEMPLTAGKTLPDRGCTAS